MNKYNDFIEIKYLGSYLETTKFLITLLKEGYDLSNTFITIFDNDTKSIITKKSLGSHFSAQTPLDFTVTDLEEGKNYKLTFNTKLTKGTTGNIVADIEKEFPFFIKKLKKDIILKKAVIEQPIKLSIETFNKKTLKTKGYKALLDKNSNLVIQTSDNLSSLDKESLNDVITKIFSSAKVRTPSKIYKELKPKLDYFVDYENKLIYGNFFYLDRDVSISPPKDENGYPLHYTVLEEWRKPAKWGNNLLFSYRFLGTPKVINIAFVDNKTNQIFKFPKPVEDFKIIDSILEVDGFKNIINFTFNILKNDTHSFETKIIFQNKNDNTLIEIPLHELKEKNDIKIDIDNHPFKFGEEYNTYLDINYNLGMSYSSKKIQLETIKIPLLDLVKKEEKKEEKKEVKPQVKPKPKVKPQVKKVEKTTKN